MFYVLQLNITIKLLQDLDILIAEKTVKQLVHSSILNEEYLLNCECGFITNTNRFVNRKETYKIAFEADQIIGPNKGYPDNEIGLTSEDLY